MSWRSVARLEFDRLLRSRGLWVFAVILLAGIGFRLQGDYPLADVPRAVLVSGAFQQGLVTFVAIGSVLVAFQSISRDRQSGTLRTHLALPLSRAELLIGKVLGRSLAVAVMTIVVFLMGIMLALFEFGVVEIIDIGLIWVATLLVVVAGVSVGVAISAGTQTGRSSTLAATIYIVFVLLLWRPSTAPEIVEHIPGGGSKLLFVVSRLSPVAAFNVLTNAILGVGNSAAPWIQVVYTADPSIETSLRLASRIFETTPITLQPGFSLLVLLGWTILPITTSYLRFRRDDIASTSRR